MTFRREKDAARKSRRRAGPASSPFARPDGTCLGRFPEEPVEQVPVTPAETEAPQADSNEPINPA
jgi:hypothetical protein